MNAEDSIAGFPDHPHRGFETVTYMQRPHAVQGPSGKPGKFKKRNGAMDDRRQSHHSFRCASRSSTVWSARDEHTG